ncbi:MAG: hypothetical protein Q9227_004493 [Pyrenula ochraceoflavens]
MDLREIQASRPACWICQRSKRTRTQSMSYSSLLPLLLNIRNSYRPGLDFEDRKQGEHALGVPESKGACNIFDLFATTVSIVCLIIGICVVTPRLPAAYRLGLARQLQVIGLLLTIMNICLKHLLPKLLLGIEAAYGKSRLQNYDAILRNSALKSHTSLLWRTTLLLLLCLPIGLSLAYKTFINGVITSSIHVSNSTHGVFAAPGVAVNAYLGLNIMSNATFPFFQATRNEESLPDLPRAYGYNMLLLSNRSAAMLDMPDPALVSSYQSRLAPGEWVTISADVGGLVAQYNSTSRQQNLDPSFWKTLPHDLGWDVSSAWLSPDSYTYGALSNSFMRFDDPLNIWCFMAVFPGVAGNTSFPREGGLFESFKRSAWGFNIARHHCHATWKITTTQILLQNEGSSCGHDADLTATESFFAYWKDNYQWAPINNFMDLNEENLAQFAYGRNNSVWELPSFVVSVAASYWAPRVTIRNEPYKQEAQYEALSNWLLTKPALRDSRWLYFILAVQPVATIVVLMLNAIMLRKKPVGEGFGLMSILAGVEHKDLELLKGAGLSGRLEQPVSLCIRPDGGTHWRRSKSKADVSLTDRARTAVGLRSRRPARVGRINYQIRPETGKLERHNLAMGVEFE